MRPVHWLFALSLALFVASIGFIIAAARTAKRAPAATAATATTVADATIPIAANVRQIMTGIVDPHSKVVWDAVSTSIVGGKTEEKAPKTDEEWAAVAASAALIVESGRLMLEGSRAVDQGDWKTLSQKMSNEAAKVIDATKKKSADDVFISGGDMYESCSACHAKYLRQ